MTNTQTVPKEISPLMALYIKDSDTPEIIQKALEIAANHPYYKPERAGTPARFSTFLTEAEATHNGAITGIRVDPGTIYEQHRFNAALKQARASS